MVYKSVDEVLKKQELEGKVLPLQAVYNTTVNAGATVTISFDAPVQERWVIDELVVASATGDNIVLENILIHPDRKPYTLDYPIPLATLRNLVNSGDNRIVFEPPIIIDKAERKEKVDFIFRNTGTAGQTLQVVIKGIKIVKR
ncbi:MAG: hypothetical protein QXD80_07540 [Acidilobaceae archaeon]